MSYELESDFPLVIYNEYDAKVLNGCTATIQELERLRDNEHKLHEENEDLKEKNKYLKQALTRLVEEFDDHISDKSPIRDLIK